MRTQPTDHDIDVRGSHGHNFLRLFRIVYQHLVVAYQLSANHHALVIRSIVSGYAVHIQLVEHPQLQTVSSVTAATIRCSSSATATHVVIRRSENFFGGRILGGVDYVSGSLSNRKSTQNSIIVIILIIQRTTRGWEIIIIILSLYPE